MARRLGSITPIWNQELWIKPHFEMLSKLEKNVVLLHERPLPAYHKEHGYNVEPDRSEEYLRKYFPNVEIYKSHYPEGKEFGPDIYNEALPYVQDCDIVFRLDPDMFFTDQTWKRIVDQIQYTNFDCYRMDFANDSINYYMTGDFEHGLKDAQEMDMLAFNPKYRISAPKGSFEYIHGNETVLDFAGGMCQHFRGWNKPKSTPNPAWLESAYAQRAFARHSNNGEWYKVPQEIRTKIEDWMKEIYE